MTMPAISVAKLEVRDLAQCCHDVKEVETCFGLHKSALPGITNGDQARELAELGLPVQETWTSTSVGGKRASKSSLSRIVKRVDSSRTWPIFKVSFRSSWNSLSVAGWALDAAFAAAFRLLYFHQGLDVKRIRPRLSKLAIRADAVSDLLAHSNTCMMILCSRSEESSRSAVRGQARAAGESSFSDRTARNQARVAR